MYGPPTRYFSMFAGIGGFELGIGTRGLCVGFSETDKHAIQTYLRHFPGHCNFGDCTKIDPGALPDFDFLVGGFPCQAFSVAGKRAGFSDTRGTLFFKIARIARAKRPRLLLLENVKGLLSHGEGATFLTIVAALDELGYDLQWQVLNSKDFGVPQNRERVFIVGHLRGTPRPEVFPLEGSGCPDLKAVPHDKPRAQSIATRHLDRNGKLTSDIAPTVQASETPAVAFYPHGGNPGGVKALPNLRAHSGAIHNEVIVPGIRRLTPTECERLQGFPDGWTEGVSDTQRYKCLGNAVTVNVIEAIASKLLGGA